MGTCLSNRALSASLAAALLFACSASPYREVEVDLETDETTPGAVALSPSRGRLRVSVAAMQAPRRNYNAYSQFVSRLGELLGSDVELVQRRTYREVNEMLAAGKIDAAFVCTGGFLAMRRQDPASVEILAVPLVAGVDTYHSLIIVPATSSTQNIEDLAGKRFAFTDELSLTGRVYPIYLLRQLRLEPTRFFGATQFTHSHDRSIEAVAEGLVDGAAVDSLIYDELEAHGPASTARMRVIHRSPPLGMPPLVASIRLPAATRQRLQTLLLGIERDSKAAAALRTLHIDRFVLPKPGLYDLAANVMDAVK